MIKIKISVVQFYLQINKQVQYKINKYNIVEIETEQGFTHYHVVFMDKNKNVVQEQKSFKYLHRNKNIL